MTTENKSSLRKIVTASAPFNNPAADLVVRTSDRTQFHVVKAVLAVASPVFADMFSVAVNLPSETDSPSDYKEGTPILNVTESSGTMDTLLRLCYPVDNPEASSDDIDAIIDILAAGKKYEIEVAQTWCMSAFKNFVSASHPDRSKFRIFAVAYQWGFEDLMIFAAKCLLTNSMADMLSLSIPELTEVDARIFQRLWTYRQQCELAVIRQTDITLWLAKRKRPWAPLWIKGSSVCGCKQVKAPVLVSENDCIILYIKAWLCEFLHDVKTKVIGRCLLGQKLSTAVEYAVHRALSKVAECSKCSSGGGRELRIFAEGLILAMQQSIDLIDSSKFKFRRKLRQQPSL